MVFPPVRKDMTGLLQDIMERLGLVERRLSKGAPASSTGTIGEGSGINISGTGTLADPYVFSTERGSTAERDAEHGTPANDAARVALANQKVVWFNTDTGWPECYYAVTALSGLTVRGLVAGTASGWYPIGPGPKITLVPSAAQSIGPGTTFTNWTAPGTGISHRDGGTAYFTYSSGAITIVRAGRYAVTIRFAHQGGTGMHELIVIRNNTVSDPFTLSWMARTLSTAAWTQSQLTVRDYAIVAGDNYRIRGVQGTFSMGMGGDGTNRFSGEFTIEYLGPDLVTE